MPSASWRLESWWHNSAGAWRPENREHRRLNTGMTVSQASTTRWQTGKTLNSPLGADMPNLYRIYGTIFSETKLKAGEATPAHQAKEREITSELVGKAETQSHSLATTHSYYNREEAQNCSLSHIADPTLRPPPERGVQNTWLWRPVWLTPTRPTGLWWSERCLLKGLGADSPTPGPNAEAALWKAPRFCVNETHFLIWKYWSEVRDPLGLSPGLGVIFLHSCWLAKASGTTFKFFSVSYFFSFYLFLYFFFFPYIFPLFLLFFSIGATFALQSATPECQCFPEEISKCLMPQFLYLVGSIFVATSRRHPLTAWLWKPGELVFLYPCIPWNWNNQRDSFCCCCCRNCGGWGGRDV